MVQYDGEVSNHRRALLAKGPAMSLTVIAGEDAEGEDLRYIRWIATPDQHVYPEIILKPRLANR